MKRLMLGLVIAAAMMLGGCVVTPLDEAVGASAMDPPVTTEVPVPPPDIAPEEAAPPASTEEAPAPPPVVDYAALRPYEAGEIMILMYHGIVENATPQDYYQRNKDEFWHDLQALYDAGFRNMPLKDLIHNHVSVAPGFTPVVFTFDDGLATSYSLIEQDGKLIPDPDCGLGILQAFNAEHPGFGAYATFFVNGGDAFDGAGTYEQRLRYLIEHDCDVGNHTLTHPRLNQLNADEVQKEIGAVDQLIRDTLPGYEPFALAYPFGIRPTEELHPLALDGAYNGKPYRYQFALREGQSGASNIPNRFGFDPLNIPRARGSETKDESTDLWGRLRFYAEHPEYRYISDGDPDTIAVPRAYAGNVDEATLGGRRLIVYD